jgi:protein import protein ZIM17
MSDEDSDSMQARRDQEPVYLLTFTCKPCDHRSAHRVTKHGYHQGTVVITCPGCSARHVISDHLKIFSDKPITLEDILARKGLKLTKGTMKGDMEWWDGSSAEASADANPETTDTQDNGNTQQPTNPPDTSNKP